MDKELKPLGLRLKEICEKNFSFEKYSVQTVADFVNSLGIDITYNGVKRWMEEKSNPSPECLAEFERLGYSSNWVLYGTLPKSECVFCKRVHPDTSTGSIYLTSVNYELANVPIAYQRSQCDIWPVDRP